MFPCGQICQSFNVYRGLPCNTPERSIAPFPYLITKPPGQSSVCLFLQRKCDGKFVTDIPYLTNFVVKLCFAKKVASSDFCHFFSATLRVQATYFELVQPSA